MEHLCVVIAAMCLFVVVDIGYILWRMVKATKKYEPLTPEMLATLPPEEYFKNIS